MKISDLPEEIIPASPEDIKIPVPPSGTISPSPFEQERPENGSTKPASSNGYGSHGESGKISQQHV